MVPAQAGSDGTVSQAMEVKWKRYVGNELGILVKLLLPLQSIKSGCPVSSCHTSGLRRVVIITFTPHGCFQTILPSSFLNSHVVGAPFESHQTIPWPPPPGCRYLLPPRNVSFLEDFAFHSHSLQHCLFYLMVMLIWRRRSSLCLSPVGLL